MKITSFTTEPGDCPTWFIIAVGAIPFALLFINIIAG